MTVQTVPAYLQNASHSAAVFRQAVSAPFQTAGILGIGELAISQQGTPNMSVILGPGRAMVAGSQVSAPSGLSFTTQAMYNVLNDGAITLTVTTANATNPRIDAVYIGVQDAFYSGSNNTALAGIVAGTPAASPVAPSLPANSLLLGYIAVGANVTSIVTANITTAGYAAALSGAVPSLPSLTAVNALFPAPNQGQLVYRQDLGTIMQYSALYNATTNKYGKLRAGWAPVVPAGQRIVPTSADLSASGCTATVDEFGTVSVTNSSGSAPYIQVSNVMQPWERYLHVTWGSNGWGSGSLNVSLVSAGTVHAGGTDYASTWFWSVAGTTNTGGGGASSIALSVIAGGTSSGEFMLSYGVDGVQAAGLIGKSMGAQSSSGVGVGTSGGFANFSTAADGLRFNVGASATTKSWFAFDAHA